MNILRLGLHYRSISYSCTYSIYYKLTARHGQVLPLMRNNYINKRNLYKQNRMGENEV
jgi:hypothetical protein